jgi:group I intron endonuclease
MSQGIYKITNLITDDCYIGQSVNIENRWAVHIRTSKRTKGKEFKRPLYRSIRKNGIENFRFDILELVPLRELLTKKEQYYYDLYKPKYNLKEPDENFANFRNKEIYKISPINLQILNTFKNLGDASEQEKIAHYTMQKICSNKGYQMFDYYYCYTTDYSKDWKPKLLLNKRRIIQIDVNTMEIINIHDGIKEACIKTGLNRNNITNSVNNITISYNGYYWVREKDYSDDWKPKENIKNAKVLQIDLETKKVLRIFDKLKEASAYMNTCDQIISKACLGKKENYGGYIWRYEKNER